MTMLYRLGGFYCSRTLTAATSRPQTGCFGLPLPLISTPASGAYILSANSVGTGSINSQGTSSYRSSIGRASKYYYRGPLYQTMQYGDTTVDVRAVLLKSFQGAGRQHRSWTALAPGFLVSSPAGSLCPASVLKEDKVLRPCDEIAPPCGHYSSLYSLHYLLIAAPLEMTWRSNKSPCIPLDHRTVGTF
jgi:hypothetical protein